MADIGAGPGIDPDLPAPRRRLGGSIRDLPPEILALAGVAFCVALGFGILAPAIPIFARSFDVSATAASAVISIFALVRLITSPLSGWLVNRLGERTVMTTGLIIVAVSSALAGLSQDYLHLLVLRGIGGAGSSMFTVSAMALLLRVAAPEIRGRAVGTFQGGFLFGGVTGPALGGLVTSWSVRAPFFVYAGTLALAAVVAMVFLARSQLADRTEPGAPDAVPGLGLAAALRDRAYQAALVVNLGQGFSTFGLRSSLLPLFIVEGLRRGPGLTGIGLLVAAVVQAALLLPAGRVADMRGRRPAMIAGTAITAVGMAGLVVTVEPVLFLLSMAVTGAGTAFLGSAPAAVVGDIAGSGQRGSVVALFQMASDLGAIVGPLVAGLIIDNTGSYPIAFGLGAAVAAVGVVMTVRMPETRGRDAGPRTQSTS